MQKYKFCKDCPLRARPLVLWDADDARKELPLMLFIGEAPGITEADQGKPFVGVAGQILKSAIRKASIHARYRLAFANAMCCWPPDDKIPSRNAAQHCADHILLPLVDRLSPDRIVALGNTATGVLGLGYTGIMGKRGQFGDYRGIPVLMTIHSAAVAYRPERQNAFERDIAKSAGPTEATGMPDWQVLDTPEQAVQMLQQAMDHKVVAIDLETTGLDPWRDEIICLSFAFNGDVGYVIYTDVLRHPDVLIEIEELISTSVTYDDAERLWHDPSSLGGIVITGHNLKFDLEFLAYLVGTMPTAVADTVVMHSVCFPGEQHDLKFVAADLCGAPAYADDLNAAKRKGTFLAVDTDILSKYSAWDAAFNWRVYSVLRRNVCKHDRLKSLMTMLTRAEMTLLQIERNGIAIDLGAQAALANRLTEKLQQIEQEARDEVGDPNLNPRSNPQVAHYCYDVLALEPRVTVSQAMKGQRQVSMKHRPKRTTDEAYLRTVMYHPFPRHILRYRKLAKLMSTYVRSLPLMVDADSRLHATFNLHVAITGRTSSSGPNLQNLPHRGGVRTMYTVNVGNVMLQFDYSQIEMRIVGLLSGDPWLIEQYRLGRDLHGEVAVALFGEDYTPDQRKIAKGINFGILYGMSPEGLAQGQGISLSEAALYIAQYFARMPRLRAWVVNQGVRATRGEVISTSFGRQWHWGVVTRGNKGEIERLAVNYPVQSTASDVMLCAMTEVQKTLGEYAWIVSTVHDSIYVETTPENVHHVVSSARQIMESVATELLGDLIPYPVDVSIGRSMSPMTKYTPGIDVTPFVRSDRNDALLEIALSDLDELLEEIVLQD